MKVVAKAYEPGTRRFEYHFQWYAWALPLRVAIGTSFYPTADSGMDISRWDKQTVLIVDVLCFRMVAVVAGPLLADGEPD